MLLNDLIGVPYKDGGRDLSGLDCYGTVLLYEREFKHKNLIDVQYDNHNIELSNEFAPLLNIKKTDSIYDGVILEMHVKNELHIGVAISSKLMIHATRNQGVRISSIAAYPIVNKYEVL